VWLYFDLPNPAQLEKATNLPAGRQEIKLYGLAGYRISLLCGSLFFSLKTQNGRQSFSH